MTAAALDTVYKTYAAQTSEQQKESQPGSIEVGGTGGPSVNVYWSNADAKPIDASSMTLDQNSPFTEGVYEIAQAAEWVLFESAAGTPTVKAFRAIDPGSA